MRLIKPSTFTVRHSTQLKKRWKCGLIQNRKICKITFNCQRLISMWKHISPLLIEATRLLTTTRLQQQMWEDWMVTAAHTNLIICQDHLFNNNNSLWIDQLLIYRLHTTNMTQNKKLLRPLQFINQAMSLSQWGLLNQLF